MARLTIKFKLIGLIILTVLLLLSGLSTTVWFNMKNMALDTHEENAKIELRLIAQYVKQFIASAGETTGYLAQSPKLETAVTTFPKFFEQGSGDSIVEPEPDDPKFGVYEDWGNVMKTQPSVSCVFMGAEDGGFYMYPKSTLGHGYDPRSRTWYKQARSSSDDLVLTSSYMSTTGEAVVNTVVRVKSDRGDTVGYLGLDIGLGTITNMLGDITIGNSGYVIFMESDGTIIADPKHEKFLFKKAKDIGVEGIAAIAKSKGGMFKSVIDDKLTLINVLDIPEMNYKLAVLIDYDEVMESAVSTQYVILGIGLGLSLLLLVFGFVVSRSIVKPIGLMVGSAESIAQGNYDNVPEDSNFGGELLRLAPCHGRNGWLACSGA